MTTLDHSTFEYLQPTRDQLETMQGLRAAAAQYAEKLEELLPDNNADKTYLMRKLREVAMWANICATRHQDGAPRGQR